jgi:ligand-binding SRPBCC domain-containing protein
MPVIYRLERVQKIPVSLEEVWDFFSSPNNLNKITPKHMKPDADLKMFAGQIIAYKVHPILGIPLSWVTEITHVKDNEYFVDEQRSGPYKLWHHLHRFKQIDGGVEMTDILHYQLPYGFLGAIANTLMVKKQLKEIFDYRYKVMLELYGEFK